MGEETPFGSLQTKRGAHPAPNISDPRAYLESIAMPHRGTPTLATPASPAIQRPGPWTTSAGDGRRPIAFPPYASRVSDAIGDTHPLWLWGRPAVRDTS